MDPKVRIRRCDVCLKICKSATELKLHAKTHSEEWPHSLDVRDEAFTQKSHFRKHKEKFPSYLQKSIENVEEPAYSFERPSTSAQTKKPMEYDKTASGQIINTFTSKNTEELIEDMTVDLENMQLDKSLRQKFEEMEIEEKKFQCQFCQQEFPDQVSRKKHEKEFHHSN
ncbi:zinc finger and BTB domain-containing protein 41-like isoform X3 [Centruroides sculpturatus]|uniref:zinc finger and BTB domain-containing protein 41-like isoform X3 n=1 Tax=Centruroides sculpturatus TaxID=218467 RepID=UPI000C6D7888|nr:zinc finger and BTB domain-containing protein 41-like isoform X3 [Centruroides sculpturatus]